MILKNGGGNKKDLELQENEMKRKWKRWCFVLAATGSLWANMYLLPQFFYSDCVGIAGEPDGGWPQEETSKDGISEQDALRLFDLQGGNYKISWRILKK